MVCLHPALVVLDEWHHDDSLMQTSLLPRTFADMAMTLSLYTKQDLLLGAQCISHTTCGMINLHYKFRGG